MKNTSKAMLLSLSCLLLMMGAARTVQNARTQGQLNALLQPSLQLDEVYDPAKQPARKKRAWQLYNSWKARDKLGSKAVAAQIIPFLRDDYGVLRENAARMLGRLEDPVTKAPLQKLLQGMQNGATRKNYVRPEILKLALGRIEARNLRGEVKLNTIAKRVGLSWNNIAPLSRKVKADYASRTAGHRIIKEIVDILYGMGRRGEDIQPLIQKLELYPPQKVLLQSASLPPNKRAKVMVDYLAQLNTVSPWDGDLAEIYLLDLRASAATAILQKLQQMKKGTAKYGRTGPVELFQVAALLDERRAIPLIQHFQKTAKQPMSGYAQGALLRFEATQYIGQWDSPRSPTPPLL